MTKTICSIFFNKCGPAKRIWGPDPNRGGLTTYEIEAAPRGEYRLLNVEDAFQREYVGSKNYVGIPVSGDSIATDIVKEFSEGVMLARFGGPGVFVCRADEPSADELRAANKKQTRWCRALINEAQGDWIRGKRDHIHEGSVFHKAAEWMGESYEWMKPPEQVFTASCPFCGAQVPAGVPVCATCGRTINPALEKQIQEQMAKLAESTAKIQAEVLAENPTATLEPEEKPEPAAAKPPIPPPLKPGVRQGVRA
ncbi:MAG TPA: hypothetical protein VN428_02380 [Bryobacteraceae bacterium]|nr:hypothetical protein [Bryobacteraceae bacterium]